MNLKDRIKKDAEKNLEYYTELLKALQSSDIKINRNASYNVNSQSKSKNRYWVISADGKNCDIWTKMELVPSLQITKHRKEVLC